jgi:hypothetical protein
MRIIFIIAGLSAVLALSGCQTSGITTQEGIQLGCIAANTGAQIGADVAKGGAASTASAVSDATNDGCSGLGQAAAVIAK